MIDVKELEKLAVLARIKIDESEKEELTKDIGSILTCVDTIKKATIDVDYTPEVGVVHNVWREDIVKNTSVEDREGLLREAPHREGEFVAVKKIIV